jgi:hypothetical protein
MRIIAASATVLVFVAIVAACDKPPTAPQPPPPPGQGVANVPPSLSYLVLAGPGEVAAGGTAQFTVMAFYTDGSSRDVSSEAVWRTTNAPVLSISATGLASGHAPGESDVVAVFGTRGTSKSMVIVTRPGTYRLTGIVKDGGFAVSGAEVAVSAGPAEGLSTTSFFWGYKLFGVSGDTEIRVRRSGYQERKLRIVVTAHERLDIDLALSGPRDPLNGRWTLTITAADECRATLPGEALERRYAAALSLDGHQQDGPRVTATLEGGTFYRAGNQTFNVFQGRSEPDRLTFRLAGAAPYVPYFGDFTPGDVFEQLSGGLGFLSIGGSVVLGASGDRRGGSLDGVIATFGGPPEYPLIRSCESSRHRFELAR